jgi:hypothetical protein
MVDVEPTASPADARELLDAIGKRAQSHRLDQ